MPVPDVEEFAERAGRFLSAHAELKPAERIGGWGQGPDQIELLFPKRSPAEEEAAVEAARGWRRIRFDAGFGWIEGPPRYGGGGLTTAHARAYSTLESRYDVPPTDMFMTTDGIVAPPLLKFGGEAAKHAHLPAFYRGDLLGCQLFSEPGAGSDLAAVSTRARMKDDCWVVSGQKVWSSGAHLADSGLLLARARPDAPAREALTMFLVDMKDRRVTVAPLRQMTGGSHFNQVFLDDVTIPDEMRIGEVHAGWRVAMAALGHERSLAGFHGLTMAPVERLRALVHQVAPGNPIVRQRLAEVYTHARLLEWSARRATELSADPAAAGSVGSTLKLGMANNLQRISALAGGVLGSSLVADDGTWGTYSWADLVLWAPGFRLAGGSDEIHRNTIAERVLGLPRS